MYEELVERLRNKGCQICPICREAADAIEELIPFKKNVEKGMGLLDKAEELLNALKPRWIPVEERLPKEYDDVSLQFQHNQAVGFWDGECWCVYSGDNFYTDVAENEEKPTHWTHKLPEPPKEET